MNEQLIEEYKLLTGDEQTKKAREKLFKKSFSRTLFLFLKARAFTLALSLQLVF